MNKTIEIFGWYGAIAIVAAYLAVSFSFLASDSLWFQLLNLTGALGITTVSLYKKTYQPAAVNFIWTVIAIIALIKIIL